MSSQQCWMMGETDLFASPESPDKQFIKDIIHCNALSTATMTRIVMPKMLTQKISKPAIINIASYSGLNLFPYLSMYAATKSFVIQLSNCISQEDYPKDIMIQTVCPLLVATPMSKMDKATLFIPTAQTYVKSALDMLGVENQTYGYICHDLKAFLFDLLPKPIWIILTKARVKSMQKYRASKTNTIEH
ncbi:unnamed protein product [Heterobilharzia americana]|nr:unnamed protein product [Heterobilharzia americana]